MHHFPSRLFSQVFFWHPRWVFSQSAMKLRAVTGIPLQLAFYLELVELYIADLKFCFWIAIQA